MSLNVGDIQEFQLGGGPPTPQNLAFVWAWWDGTTDVTNIPKVIKTINMGGDPNNAFQLLFSCTVVDDIGQNQVFAGTVAVNNPPSLLPGSARLLANDRTFPFPTYGTLAAYDLESQALSFSWSGNGVFLGNGTNFFNFGHVTGTYAGQPVGQRMVSSSGIDFIATGAGSLVCNIMDSQGGTAVVEFPIYGKAPQSINLSSNASASGVSVDAAGTPQIRIGANEFAQFVVYTPSQTHQLGFQWAYFGSNGWAQTLYSNGTTTAFSDGSFQNVDIKPVAGETPGPKVAEVFVRDNTTGQISTVKLGITLLIDNPPTISGVDILPTTPHVGDFMSFSANATDTDFDLVHYAWQFTSPVVSNLYGRKVFLNTTGYPHGQRITGVLTVIDNLGAATTFNFQSAPLT